MGMGKKKGGMESREGLAKQQPASFGAKKVGIPLKDGGKVKAESPMKKSYSAGGNMVKKLPMKLAAGGVAKERKGFPNTSPSKKE